MTLSTSLGTKLLKLCIILLNDQPLSFIMTPNAVCKVCNHVWQVIAAKQYIEVCFYVKKSWYFHDTPVFHFKISNTESCPMTSRSFGKPWPQS